MQRPAGASPPRYGKRGRSRSPEDSGKLEPSRARQPPPPTDSRYQQGSSHSYGRPVGPGGADTRHHGSYQQPQHWQEPHAPQQYRPHPARGGPWGKHDLPPPDRSQHAQPPWSHSSSSGKPDSRQAYWDSHSSSPGRRREPPHSSSRQRPRSRSPGLRQRIHGSSPTYRRRSHSRSPRGGCSSRSPALRCPSHSRSPFRRRSSSRSPRPRRRSHSRSPARRGAPAPCSPAAQRRGRSPEDTRSGQAWSQQQQQRPRSRSPGRGGHSPLSRRDPGRLQQQQQKQQQAPEARCSLPG
jgi:hypothetical protein